MKTGEPRVSVILNTYNSTRYLAATLDSICAQTVTDWEVVVWDNRSTDGTVAQVEARGDPRFRVHVAPRAMTLAEGRNEALDRARGEWLAFLDHDDLWEPRKLEAQLACVDSPEAAAKVGLVYTRARSFSSRGDEGEMIFRYEGRPLPEGRILTVLLEEGSIIPLSSAMVRRRAWEAVRPIPAHLQFAEDYWLFAAIAEHWEVRCVQEVQCRYRVHPGSATARFRHLSHIESIEVLDRWRTHLSEERYWRRRRICESLWAAEMIVRERRLWAGLGKLLREGSPAFFLRGACSHFFRRYIRGRRPVS